MTWDSDFQIKKEEKKKQNTRMLAFQKNQRLVNMFIQMESNQSKYGCSPKTVLRMLHIELDTLLDCAFMYPM